MNVIKEKLFDEFVIRILIEVCPRVVCWCHSEIATVEFLVKTFG